MKSIFRLAVFCLLTVAAVAQSSPSITLTWPSDGKPLLKLTVGKFQPSGMVNGQEIFVADVSVQNVSDQGMPRSVFTVFILDKNNVRIGQGRLQLPAISPYRTQASQLQFSAAGTPVGITLLAGKTIPLKVISVPAGAKLKVDGEDAGVTPKVVDFTIGSHTLEFSMEGYTKGTTPLDVGADELPGGSISFELGGLSQDSIELRDGTTLQGDVMSMSLTSVVLRVDGKEQKYDRNQVKKITLVERITTPVKPDAAKSKP